MRQKIMPARGPRRDLWVVVVTTSAYSKGEAITPAATRPLQIKRTRLKKKIKEDKVEDKATRKGRAETEVKMRLRKQLSEGGLTSAHSRGGGISTLRRRRHHRTPKEEASEHQITSAATRPLHVSISHMFYTRATHATVKGSFLRTCSGRVAADAEV